MNDQQKLNILLKDFGVNTEHTWIEYKPMENLHDRGHGGYFLHSWDINDLMRWSYERLGASYQECEHRIHLRFNPPPRHRV